MEYVKLLFAAAKFGFQYRIGVITNAREEVKDTCRGILAFCLFIAHPLDSCGLTTHSRMV
jgi:hypothetical protein